MENVNWMCVLIGLIFGNAGYWLGKRQGRKQIIDLLNIPKGSEISAISFRKKVNGK